MAVATARGAKRKCQNDECALPFYDLNRHDVACPNCGTAFDIALEARERDAPPGAYQGRRKPRELVIVAPPDAEPAAWDDEVDDDDEHDDVDERPSAAVSPDQPLLDADNDTDEDIDDIAPPRPGGGAIE